MCSPCNVEHSAHRSNQQSRDPPTSLGRTVVPGKLPATWHHDVWLQHEMAPAPWSRHSEDLPLWRCIWDACLNTAVLRGEGLTASKRTAQRQPGVNRRTCRNRIYSPPMRSFFVTPLVAVPSQVSLATVDLFTRDPANDYS